MFGNPMEIAILVGAAVLLFGADRVPKLARGLGQARKEFMVGQAEADVAAERARAEARAQAEAAPVVPPPPAVPSEPAAPPH
jgi:sec-independent protein translocase protein TatA